MTRIEAQEDWIIERAGPSARRILDALRLLDRKGAREAAPDLDQDHWYNVSLDRLIEDIQKAEAEGDDVLEVVRQAVEDARARERRKSTVTMAARQPGPDEADIRDLEDQVRTLLGENADAKFADLKKWVVKSGRHPDVGYRHELAQLIEKAASKQKAAKEKQSKAGIKVASRDVTAANTWRPIWTGKRDQSVEVYNAMPGYISEEILCAMTRVVLLAYLTGVRRADRRYQFQMPLGTLAKKLDVTKNSAWRAIQELLKAGLWQVLHPGNSHVPTVYQLASTKSFNAAATLLSLQQDRDSNRDGLARRIGKRV